MQAQRHVPDQVVIQQMKTDHVYDDVAAGQVIFLFLLNLVFSHSTKTLQTE